MDTEVARRFGAVELSGTLRKLARSKRAKTRLIKAVGKAQSRAAVQMLKAGVLTGPLGNEVHDFFLEEIENNSNTVWEGYTYDPEDPENLNAQFPVGINEYEGVYYVWALEVDPCGYFLNQRAVRSYISSNWDHVKATTR